MNLRDLRYIVAVADHGHFGRASTACAVSQPTLSGQILKLEKELGVEVFERDGKSVRLTPAGQPIVAHARRCVTAADDLLAAAALHRDPDAAPLRLGIIPTLAPYIMPLVLPALRDAMPRLRLMLAEDVTDRLMDLLGRGDLDAALIASAPHGTGLHEAMLFDEPFWLVLPKDHPLAAREVVEADAIDSHAMLLLQDGHCLRDQALELCRRPHRDARAMADMRATTLDTLLQMAAAGHGMTLMPHLAILRGTQLPEPLVARRLGGEHTSRRVRLVSRTASARHHFLDQVAAVVRDCLPATLPPTAVSPPRGRGSPRRTSAATAQG